MSSLIGNRTLIVAAAMAIAGQFAKYGFGVDPTLLADVFMIAVPAVMAFMRSITRTPVGKST